MKALTGSMPLPFTWVIRTRICSRPVCLSKSRKILYGRRFFSSNWCLWWFLISLFLQLSLYVLALSNVCQRKVFECHVFSSSMTSPSTKNSNEIFSVDVSSANSVTRFWNKSSPIFSTKCPKSNHHSYYLKATWYQEVPIWATFVGFFFTKTFEK